jgi:hypothetical protein
LYWKAGLAYFVELMRALVEKIGHALNPICSLALGKELSATG